jgi:hypothetical protein
MTDLKKIIKDIEKSNPYPISIFPEYSDEDWNKISEFLLKHGKNPDRIFATFGRMAWNNYLNKLKEYIDK